MYCFYHRLSLFICYTLIIFQSQTSATVWQSYFDLSNKGLEFSPFDQQALLLFETAKSILICGQNCLTMPPCRTFNFDTQTKYCRLYEGDMDSTGSVVASLSSQSICGSMKLLAEDFLDYGRSCSYCQDSRYLTCMNSSCQCQLHTYFDGSICRSQKLNGSECTSDIECRNDLNLTCLSNMQCGSCVLNNQSSWSQTANTVAGNSSGGSGSTLLQLNDPIPIYYDQPNNAIIVGDRGNHRVITFSLSNPSSDGTVIAGGNGEGCSNTNQFGNTVGVALDSSRQLYVADSGCFQLLQFPSNSNSTTFGVYISYLYVPEGIFIDPLTDDLYVAIYGDNSVVKFASGSTTPVVVAGGNGAGNGLNQLNAPNGVYFDYLYTNSLYVIDSGNNRVLKFPSSSTNATFGTIVAGSNSGGNGLNQLDDPRNLVVDSNGILYISDKNNNRIQRWLPNASSGDTIIGGTAGTASNELNGPEGIVFDENYNILIVDRNNNRVQLFNVTVC